jgi:NAD(P)-dependent dehydrogenase (short-subunit alcohol dehydrogenase family)
MFVKDLEPFWEISKISNLFNVTNKKVVITGGSRGIGLMIAQGFIQNGSSVIIISRDEEACKKVSEELTKKGPGICSYLSADLSKISECKRIVEEIEKKENYIDILINNSGCTWGAPLNDFPEFGWDKVMNLNVKSIFFLIKYCIPLLEKSAKPNSPSKIINIGSIDGIRIPSLETYSYSSSKAALHHLTKVLASKLAEKNITVNAIAAGAFETKMMASTLKQFGNIIKNSIPLQRIGTPPDICGICIYLSSTAGNWVTGAIIPVEGGVLISSKF